MSTSGRGPIAPGRCYVIAEVGINHNGDLELARQLIDMAAAAGADAVKFQNFRTEDFIADRELTWSYEVDGQTVSELQYDMFKRCEFIGERLAAAAAHCRARNIDFAATPTGQSGIDECMALGAAFLKNGSDYLTHLPIIRAMGRTGLQTVISTGMATEAEIEDAVAAFRDAGGRDLVLLHCVSLYPAPANTLNLNRIASLERRFGCPVGFSDHSEGIAAAGAAAALGAVAIERHVTLDKAMPGPDHRFSADRAELRALVASIRTIEAALGDGRIGLTEHEAAAQRMHRLSCIAARALSRGSVLREADIEFRRPGEGLPPKAAGSLIGRRLKRDVRAGERFASEDVL
jgi:N,N'-diacetyllegionaminate synthase